MAQEFAEIWVVDLGGDVRANPKLSGTKHNVFGIQTGVAISLPGQAARAQGLPHPLCAPAGVGHRRGQAGLARHARERRTIRFERVVPDKRANWINQDENDWDDLIPVADKKTKAAKRRSQERAIFKLYSLGVSPTETNGLRCSTTP